MKTIQLQGGKCAMVDDEDFDFINRLTWTYITRGNSEGLLLEYAELSFSGEGRGSRGSRIYLHRLLCSTKGKHGYRVMHKNGNGLDCRKENLMSVPYHTVLNKARKRPLHKGAETTSRFKGVWWASRFKYFTGGIKKDGVFHSLGHSNDEKEMARRYNVKARELYGELAYQNELE